MANSGGVFGFYHRGDNMFTNEQHEILRSNGRKHNLKHDAIPSVYLFGETAAFLISEISYEDPRNVFGLYYDINNIPQLGMIDSFVIEQYHQNTEYLFNDKTYQANYPIQVFFRVAQELGTIIPDDNQFLRLFEKYNY